MVSARDDNHARCDWIPDNRAKGAISGMTLVEVFPGLRFPPRSFAHSAVKKSPIWQPGSLPSSLCLRHYFTAASKSDWIPGPRFNRPGMTVIGVSGFTFQVLPRVTVSPSHRVPWSSIPLASHFQRVLSVGVISHRNARCPK